MFLVTPGERSQCLENRVPQESSAGFASVFLSLCSLGSSPCLSGAEQESI